MSKDAATRTVQCSACSSVFRVQPQHLSAAQGWLQCGVCGHVFRADLPQPAAVEPPPPAPPPPATAAVGDHPPRESTSVVDESPSSEAVVQAGPDAAPAATASEMALESASEAADAAALPGLTQRMSEVEAAAPIGPKLESIILVDPDIPAGEVGPLPTFTQEEAPPPAATATAAATVEKPVSATERNWIPRQVVEPPQTRPRKTKTGWWALLAVPLVLILAAQLVYFLRDQIAVRHPALRPPLAEMCTILDCTLTLPRDAKQVQILGSDLQTEGQGNLSLAFTLANRANHAMAWPVLELTLTDVKDQAVGRRTFAPSEYLPSPEMEAAGIQPVSEVPLTLKLQTRDIKAVGYRLKMFY